MPFKKHESPNSTFPGKMQKFAIIVVSIPNLNFWLKTSYKSVKNFIKSVE